MPYASVDDIPQSVKDRIKSSKKRRQWLHVWNSSYESHHDEGRAFASANSAVKKAAGMTDSVGNFSLFLPIAKVDKERRTVSGYASTAAMDMDGEIVEQEAMKAALPGYWKWRNIREMHQPSAVGTAEEANIDEKGLFLTAKIVDDAAWQKCLDQVYKGFSIGGRKLAKTGNKITKVDLIEISIVDRPANPECSFTVQKSAKAGGEAFLLKTPGGRPKAADTLSKVVDLLTNPDGDDEEDPIEVSPPVPVADFAKAEAERRERKLAKKAKKAAKLAKKAAASVEESTPMPSFLTLDVGSGIADTAGGETGFGHELSLGEGSPILLQKDGADDIRLSKRDRKLLKRMGVAGNLSYCFDQIRSAQRDLIREAKTEGGDQKDLSLARKLGSVAQNLAAVIGQKADHEGEEALSLTDADDLSFMSIYGDVQMSATNDPKAPDSLTKFVMELLAKNGTAPSPKADLDAAKKDLKKAREMRKEAAEAVKTAFEMHKTAYLAKQALVKAGKAKDDDGFDHGNAMKMLQKAYGALTNMKTFSKSASENLAKAASRVRGDGVVEQPVTGVYEVPDGIKLISPTDMDNLDPAKMAKAGLITQAHAEALVKAARAEAEADMLKSLPANPVHGRRPHAFDMTKFGLATGSDEPEDSFAKFFKGADPKKLASEDEATRTAELGKVIYSKIFGGEGKSLILDPNFHGTAGGSA